MAAYIFLFRKDSNPINILETIISIDSFAETVTSDLIEYCKLKEDDSEILKYSDEFNAISMRMRLCNEIIPHIFKVQSEIELTRDILQIYIQYMNSSEITLFMNEAKI
jgi:hypothetical protein